MVCLLLCLSELKYLSNIFYYEPHKLEIQTFVLPRVVKSNMTVSQWTDNNLCIWTQEIANQKEKDKHGHLSQWFPNMALEPRHCTFHVQ